MNKEFLIFTLLVLLVSGKVFSSDNSSWNLDFSVDKWKAAPEKLGSESLYQAVTTLEGFKVSISQDGSDKVTPYSTKSVGEGIEFSILGNPSYLRSMLWILSGLDKDLSDYKYCVIRYRSKGVARNLSPNKIITLIGTDSSGKSVTLPIFEGSQPINDGRWHELVINNNFNIKLQSINMRLDSYNSSAFLEIESVSFYKSFPGISGYFDYQPNWNNIKSKSLVSLDIKSAFNDKISNAIERRLATAPNGIVDACPKFTSEKISVDGVPFTVVASGNNIIHPVESVDWMKEEVDFAGYKIPRIKVVPQQRNDALSVNIGKKVCEVYFMFVCEMPPVLVRYNAAPLPFRFRDIEAFKIELKYADGTSELAFPYSIDDKGFTIQRTTGAYVVPADFSKVLKEVVVYNRTYKKTVNIAAVTINTSSKRVFVNAWAEPKVIKVPVAKTPKPLKPFINLKDGIITAGNTYYDVKIDCRNGFVISGLTNRYLTDGSLKFDKSSGLEIKIGDKLLTGRSFKVENINIDGLEAVINLKSIEEFAPLGLVIKIRPDNTPELNMKLSLTNNSSGIINPDVRFPAIKNLVIGSKNDTWYFFPQLRNIISNKEGFYRHIQDRGFPNQFFDVYNPVIGSGITFLTHNLDHAPAEFIVSKDSKGVDAYIQFPAMFYPTNAGETKNFVETSIGFHSGDWHNGVDVYKDWLSTWYKPFNSQDKDWFKKVFWHRTYVLSQQYAWYVWSAPSLYDKRTDKYIIDEYLDFDKKLYDGLLPETVEYTAWAWDYGRDIQRDGEYGKKDYDDNGGIEKIKESVKYFEDKYGIIVNPYTISDRYHDDTEFYKQYGLKGAVQYKDGTYAAGTIVSACKGSTLWRNFIVDTIARVQKDWGDVKSVYLDVYGTGADSHMLCYSKEHGHEVPMWVNKYDHLYLKELRDKIPGTALWSEYPVSDVVSQHIDGWLSYDFLSLYEYFGKSYNTDEADFEYAEVPGNIIRYALPNIKQLCFPVGIEWEDGWAPMKYIFFNGQGLFDMTWRIYTTDMQKQAVKTIKIQRKYTDCFTSDKPEHLVQTQRTGVYANKFPGNNRVFWTIYNSRYTTVKGNVIVINHKDGAKYYDAWNEKSIEPVIKDGKAYISLELSPQGLGSVVQTY